MMKNKKILFTIFLDVVLIIGIFTAPLLLRLLMDGVPNCWSLNMGIICPACGGTRCLINLLEGDFITSFIYNPMVFVIVLYLICVLLFWNLLVFTKCSFTSKVFKKLTHHYCVILLAVAFVMLGVLRNFIFTDTYIALLTSVCS